MSQILKKPNVSAALIKFNEFIISDSEKLLIK